MFFTRTRKISRIYLAAFFSLSQQEIPSIRTTYCHTLMIANEMLSNDNDGQFEICIGIGIRNEKSERYDEMNGGMWNTHSISI